MCDSKAKDKEMEKWEEHCAWIVEMRHAYSEKRVLPLCQEWEEEPVYRGGGEEEEDFDARWKESLPPLVERQFGRATFTPDLPS